MVNTETDILFENLKRGSEQTFKKVYEDNRNKFLNYARRYNLPDDDIIDIYQDVYIIFYTNIMEGKIEKFTSSISTYLFSIGKYLIFDKMKKDRKTYNPDFDISILKEKNSLTDEGFELEDQTLTKEQVLLRTHFASLGKKCQELLTLFYYRGFTIKDIIATGNYMNENVVKSAKSRCMKTLKERIKN